MRCKEHRHGGTRIWVMYSDMKIEIKRIVVATIKRTGTKQDYLEKVYIYKTRDGKETNREQDEIRRLENGRNRCNKGLLKV